MATLKEVAQDMRKQLEKDNKVFVQVPLDRGLTLTLIRKQKQGDEAFTLRMRRVLTWPSDKEIEVCKEAFGARRAKPGQFAQGTYFVKELHWLKSQEELHGQQLGLFQGETR